MAPHHPTSDSESSDEEGAPEIISLAQSKKDIQKLDAELKKAEIAERQSKRRQNRELDRKLKERADMNKSGQKKKKGGEEAGGLEEEDRMQRAMREAQEEEEAAEMDEEDESESGSEDGGSDSSSEDSRCLVGEKGSGSKHPRSRYLVDEEGSVQSEEEEEGEGEEEEDSAEEIPPPNPKKKPYNPDYLPDELFTAAFASQASASKRKATEDMKDTEQTLKKKQKRSHTQKDLIVGSRAIRVLPTSGKPITPSAAPSSKVKKFLDRSLALKGKNQKMWERRPANIGVLRREGPASNFVRNR